MTGSEGHPRLAVIGCAATLVLAGAASAGAAAAAAGSGTDAAGAAAPPAKVRAYKLGQYLEHGSGPGDPMITLVASGAVISNLYLLTPAMCTTKATGALHQVTFTIVVPGWDGLPIAANGKANGSIEVSDVAPGTMTYRIRLKGKKGTAKLHIVEEDAVQRCQSDPNFRLRWVSHPSVGPSATATAMPTLSVPASPQIAYP